VLVEEARRVVKTFRNSLPEETSRAVARRAGSTGVFDILLAPSDGYYTGRLV